MENLESQIEAILDRNKRVEIDKAWETSWTRRLSIAVLTYITALAFLWMIQVPEFAFAAIVPAAGYILSTLSLPWLKKQWIASRNKRKISNPKFQ